MKSRWIAHFVLAALLLLAACGGGRTGLPYEESFDDPASGWRTESDASAGVRYEDGSMVVSILSIGQLAWATAERDFKDFHLTVEATQVAGPDNNAYGVLARMQDDSHFYRFSISGDGYYLVDVYDDDGWERLGPDWTPSDAIVMGNATNTIELIAQGDQMTFLVNGTQLAQVEDGRFGHGDVGLYAGSFDEPGVEVRFDNLRLEAVD